MHGTSRHSPVLTRRWGPIALVAAALVTLGAAVSARALPFRDDSAEQGAARLAAATGGQLSEKALTLLVGRMDPAAASLARRHDPAAEPLPWGRAFGWETLNLRERPTFDLLVGVTAEEAQRINAAVPFNIGDVRPAPAFFLNARSDAERRRAIRCLATAIYFEAALEPEQGQRAVAQVVLNRVRDPNFPKSVCGVVYQGWERYTGCQFSFTCDGSLLRGTISALYRRAEQYAVDALNGHVVREVGTATHYHADYVAPYWAPTLVKLNKVGAHIFYRWPGNAGEPGSFVGRYAGNELRLSEAVLTGRAARPTPPPMLAALQMANLKTVTVSQPGVDGDRTRVSATIGAPGASMMPGGRRRPTADEIARINQTLAQFEAKQDVPASAPPAAAAPAEAEAPVKTAPAEPMPVVEVNKPAG